MDALCYHGPNNFTVVNTSIPDITDIQVLIKVSCCGICGTDSHIAKGEFIAAFPLIPGHEFVGKIAKVGKSVIGFNEGDRVVVDPTVFCESCFFCRRGQQLLCENFNSLGVTMSGGFADYVVADSKKVYKIFNLTDEEATLIEPAACAIHGVDKLGITVGVEALVIGSGPTGLILAQLLKLNGAAKVVVAANKGPKMETAKRLNTGDAYIELDRENPSAQWEQLKQDFPKGFDVVVEATGNEKVVDMSLGLVRRGGTLLVYGVYSAKDRVSWSPARIFGDEIKIIGSFAQANCFPRSVAYLDSGKINVKGMVTDVFSIKEWQQALDKLDSKTAVKIVVKP
ncbi:GroES-like protein [Pluteus cervinus]|uniref:GroES-like protein n=1 Tax=Pluteus cervinus TaxID=181527 RepID=A0ACD3B2R2_9AGAR|nr:GroES-like protein [Pluteus cervinus]